MAKRLELKFKNENGTTATISVDEPVEPVDAQAVKQAMLDIISQNVFTSSGGALVEIDRAQVVDRTVEVIPLD
ncbi:DUF2922 domain-containing protein [Bacillaceae bacterium W0354]